MAVKIATILINKPSQTTSSKENVMIGLRLIWIQVQAGLLPIQRIGYDDIRKVKLDPSMLAV